MSKFLDVVELDAVQACIASDSVTVVLAVASWQKHSKQLSNEVLPSSVDEATIIVLDLDDSDMEDIAIVLNMTVVPSVNIYGAGGKVVDTLLEAKATVENINASITNYRNISVHEMVASSYETTLKGGASCCVSVDSTMNGYSIEDLMTASKANLGLGCGNPLSFAALQPGETVVDLGSGAGIDCLIAGEQVGPSGLIIGVDMTPAMVYEARRNASDKTHVTFRLGEIEYLPVADNIADVVISNCVINLSPSKSQVFREIYRVLKPGGRLAICDVVLRENKTLPDSLKTAQALAC